jgi:transposase
MQAITIIGPDIAKSIFQVHAVDADGAVVIRKRIGRAKMLEFFATLPPKRNWRSRQMAPQITVSSQDSEVRR